MNVKWLVENFEADNKIHKLIAEIKSRNQPIEVIDYYNYYLKGNIQNDDGTLSASSFKDDDCVMFAGSIQLALWIKRNKPWVPGIWLDPDKFKCTTYYSYLGKYLFNKDYVFTTVGEFKRRYEHFYKTYGEVDALFIRPDSGLKSFTGQVFFKERHDTDWKYFDQTTKPEDIIVISKPKYIHREFRIVIAKGQPVAASMYRADDKSSQLPGAPKDAMNLAREIASVIDKEMNVGPMYVIDLAETRKVIDGNTSGEYEYSLMEINCFNCAGLYECDKKAVVDAANEIALAEWKEYQKP